MRRGHGRCGRLAAAVALCAAIAACDTSVGPEEGPTLVRFVNATPDAVGPLRFVLTGGPSAVLQRGDESGYSEITPRVYPTTIEDDASTWFITGELRIIQGIFQTVYAFGDASAEAAVLVGDEPARPAEGQSLLRVLHLAGGVAGAADVHILSVGEAVDPGSTDRVAGMVFPSERDYFFVDAGTHRIVLTAAGTANVLIDSGPLDFTSRGAYTAVFLNDNADAPELIRLRDGA